MGFEKYTGISKKEIDDSHKENEALQKKVDASAQEVGKLRKERIANDVEGRKEVAAKYIDIINNPREHYPSAQAVESLLADKITIEHALMETKPATAGSARFPKYRSVAKYLSSRLEELHDVETVTQADERDKIKMQLDAVVAYDAIVTDGGRELQTDELFQGLERLKASDDETLTQDAIEHAGKHLLDFISRLIDFGDLDYRGIKMSSEAWSNMQDSMRDLIDNEEVQTVIVEKIIPALHWLNSKEDASPEEIERATDQLQEAYSVVSKLDADLDSDAKLFPAS